MCPSMRKYAYRGSLDKGCERVLGLGDEDSRLECDWDNFPYGWTFADI